MIASGVKINCVGINLFGLHVCIVSQFSVVIVGGDVLQDLVAKLPTVVLPFLSIMRAYCSRWSMFFHFAFISYFS